ncbi:MAG: peptidoglycan-binding protein [Oscillospiraceae bacterium]|nr:peptidoglycan-binding protein [Oscillospiraceae bacterium]
MIQQVMRAAPYPGTPLKKGSTGDNVKLMQYDLDMIGEYLYNALGFLKVDGIFGSATEATVKQYQAIKGLTVDGIIGQKTWDAVTADYASIPDTSTDIYPGVPLTYGSTGVAVLTMQTDFNEIAPVYTALGLLKIDGVFGQKTADAVRLFQKQFGLTPDGVIGETTWYKVDGVHKHVKGGAPDTVQTVYPGAPVQYGSSGDSVRYVQSYMNRVGTANHLGFPVVKIDGQFGPNTRSLAIAFQTHFGLTADGIVGTGTWSRMITEFNNTLA